jgi:hypothetical protein
LQPCELYQNFKGSSQQLFVAAAALYYTTGTPAYRVDADSYYDAGTFKFWFNWNNVWAQGMMLLSFAPDMSGAKVSQATYRSDMQDLLGKWTTCSNEGQMGGYCQCVLRDFAHHETRRTSAVVALLDGALHQTSST